MNILVIGFGQIGSQVTKFLSQLHNVIVIDNNPSKNLFNSFKYRKLYKVDLNDHKKIQKIISFFKPEILIMASGVNAESVDNNYETGLTYLYDEPCNLINFFKKTNIRKIIYISSFSVYGMRSTDSGLPECDEKTEKKPTTKYGRIKSKCEDFIFQNWNRDFCILRPTGVFGPYNLRGGSYATKMINNLFYNLDLSKRFNIDYYGLEDIIYSKLLGNIIADIASNDMIKEEILNISSYNRESKESLQSFFKSSLGFDIDINIKERPEYDWPLLKNEKMLSLLKGKYNFSLTASLKDYYVNNIRG